MKIKQILMTIGWGHSGLWREDNYWCNVVVNEEKNVIKYIHEGSEHVINLNSSKEPKFRYVTINNRIPEKYHMDVFYSKTFMFVDNYNLWERKYNSDKIECASLREVEDIYVPVIED